MSFIKGWVGGRDKPEPPDWTNPARRVTRVRAGSATADWSVEGERRWWCSIVEEVEEELASLVMLIIMRPATPGSCKAGQQRLVSHNVCHVAGPSSDFSSFTSPSALGMTERHNVALPTAQTSIMDRSPVL